jgi:hypothetical protein
MGSGFGMRFWSIEHYACQISRLQFLTGLVHERRRGRIRVYNKKRPVTGVRNDANVCKGQTGRTIHENPVKSGADSIE